MRVAVGALHDLKSPCPFEAFGAVVVNHTSGGIGDAICIGVSCDAAAVPDSELLVQCLKEGFEEVLDLAGEHGPVRLALRDPSETT